MLKREFLVNFKNFLIWTGLIIIMFLVVFMVYPSIMSSEQAGNIDEMMKMFPPELLKAFNMDIAGIDTAFGWLKTEGFVFVLLITGVYSSILGSNILLKEESDKTIEYLNSLPITRKKIVIEKIIVSVTYIVLTIVLTGVFNYVALMGADDFDKKQFLLLSITPVFSSLTLYSVSLFISTFAHKTKKVFGISLGLVFVSYFLNTIAEMSEKTEFLKFFSAFTLADVRNVITDSAINPTMIIISILLFTIISILSIIHYEIKELI